MKQTITLTMKSLLVTALLLAPLAVLPSLSHAADVLHPVISRLDQATDN